MTLYEINLLNEVLNEEYEFKLFANREIIYWLVNIQSSKHIDRQSIYKLQSEIIQKTSIDWIKEYEKRYAERQLKKMNK